MRIFLPMSATHNGLVFAFCRSSPWIDGPPHFRNAWVVNYLVDKLPPKVQVALLGMWAKIFVCSLSVDDRDAQDKSMHSVWPI
jgi:hypothetical protein